MEMGKSGFDGEESETDIIVSIPSRGNRAQFCKTKRFHERLRVWAVTPKTFCLHRISGHFALKSIIPPTSGKKKRRRLVSGIIQAGPLQSWRGSEGAKAGCA